MEPIITFSLIVSILLSPLQGKAKNDCAHITKSTKRVVADCPRNKTEYERRKEIRNCEKVKEGCDLHYHCVVNPLMDKLVEICAPVSIIIGRVCAELNRGRTRPIQGSKHTKGECEECPITYPSNLTYKFSECFDTAIQNKIKGHTTPKEQNLIFFTPLNFGATRISSNGVEVQGTPWVLPWTLSGFIALTVLGSIIMYRKKLKKMYKKTEKESLLLFGNDREKINYNHRVEKANKQSQEMVSKNCKDSVRNVSMEIKTPEEKQN